MVQKNIFLKKEKKSLDIKRIGSVGSRIIAEVFVGLVENSKTNVFQKRPGLTFSMPELLAEVGDLNPLGSN